MEAHHSSVSGVSSAVKRSLRTAPMAERKNTIIKSPEVSFDVLKSSVLSFCLGCEFRPSDFCESLRTCDLVTKYPNSTFARRLETFRAMGENLQPIQNLSYSSDIWTRVKDLGDVPVIISKYKNIWADGTCPTQAEFIGCTFMVDAHPNGVVYPLVLIFLLMCKIDISSRLKPFGGFRSQMHARCRLGYE